MVVRFPHLGDLHLHAGPRQADRLRCFDQFVDECFDLPDLGAWLLPGDLFHAKSGIADRNALRLRVRKMTRVAPVLVCKGNHDADGDLDIFGDISLAWPIVVADTPQVRRIEIPVWRDVLTKERLCLTAFLLPWPTEAGLVSAGVAPDRIAQEARVALDNIFEGAGLEMLAARGRGDVTLAIGHANVAGARLHSVGQPSIGSQMEVDASQLARLGHCYKGFNHIHIAQEVGEGDGQAHYAGSACRLTWGETEPKSYTVVTCRLASSGAWPYSVERRSLQVAPMYHVEGRMSRDGFHDMRVTAGPDGPREAVPSRPCEFCKGTGQQPFSERLGIMCDQCMGSGARESWKGCEVRVRASYLQSEGAVLETAQAQVKRQFAAAERFEFEPVCVPDRALRSQEVAVARTFQEKLEAWATVAGVALPDGVAGKAQLLEQPDADAVVADVERRMAELSGLHTSNDAELEGSIGFSKW